MSCFAEVALQVWNKELDVWYLCVFFLLFKRATIRKFTDKWTKIILICNLEWMKHSYEQSGLSNNTILVTFLFFFSNLEVQCGTIDMYINRPHIDRYGTYCMELLLLDDSERGSAMCWCPGRIWGHWCAVAGHQSGLGWDITALEAKLFSAQLLE